MYSQFLKGSSTVGIRFAYIFSRKDLGTCIIYCRLTDSTLSTLVATLSDYFSTQLSEELGIFSSSVCLKTWTWKIASFTFIHSCGIIFHQLAVSSDVRGKTKQMKIVGQVVIVYVYISKCNEIINVNYKFKCKLQIWI